MTINTLQRGSTWHKWDLHIHSPLSALNNQFPKLSDGSPDWDSYLGALSKLSDTPALGITDYFTIDGYKEVLAASMLANYQTSRFSCRTSSSASIK
jgi:hypothetical protein